MESWGEDTVGKGGCIRRLHCEACVEVPVVE